MPNLQLAEVVPSQTCPQLPSDLVADRPRSLPGVPFKNETREQRNVSVLRYPTDSAEHTLFDCPRWDPQRLEVVQFLGGRNPAPENVEDLLCEPAFPEDMNESRRRQLTEAAVRTTSAIIQHMVNNVMTRKEEDERLLQQLIRQR